MITEHNRRSAQLELKQFCHFAKEHDFVEITRWTNEEGVTLTVSDTMGSRNIDVSDGAFQALVTLWEYMRKSDEHT